MTTQVLSRTLSEISSTTESSSTTSKPRTRKRFTSTQLTMLEQLFHQNSHPSRHDREAVAQAGEMEIKSVTIWFQNKRQTERKSKAAQISQILPLIKPSPIAPSSARARSLTSPNSISLDKVASRSEHRVDSSSPSTPRKRHSNKLWENMPSSPLGPSSSPLTPTREYVEKSHNPRTLEWACASARLREKKQNGSSGSGNSISSAPDRRPKRSSRLTTHVAREFSHQDGGAHIDSDESDNDEDTEVEDQDSEHEAITPSSSQDANDMRVWATDQKKFESSSFQYAYSTSSYTSSSFRKNSTTSSATSSTYSKSKTSSPKTPATPIHDEAEEIAVLALMSFGKPKASFEPAAGYV